MTASPSLRRQRLPTGCGPGVVIGQYRVTSLIGQGGMGAVYAAEHTLLGRTAAIKVLLADLSHRRKIVLRFFNEARAAAAIRHPGIIEIYDVGWSADNAAYIVMEHLDGESLSRRAARGPMPWHIAFALARQISGALAAAHGKGIVHRDLKPDNIFVVTDPEVPGGERIKLLDFGIAKLNDRQPDAESTLTGVVIGTPTYMAPEQCRGVAVDHRADFYSLGCLVFKLCVGRPPFVSASAGDVLASHIHSSPPLLGLFVPEIAPEAEALVQRLLAKLPEDRPQSAEEVIQLLDAATRGGNRANGSSGRKAIMASASVSSSAVGNAEVTATAFDTAASGAATLMTEPPATATGSDTAAPGAATLVPEPLAAPTGGATPAAMEGPRRRGELQLKAAIAASAVVALIVVVTREGPARTMPSLASGAPEQSERAVSTLRSGGAGASAEPAPTASPADGAAPGDAMVARSSVVPVARPEMPARYEEAGREAAPSGAPAVLPILASSKTAPASPIARRSANLVEVVIDSIPAGAEVVLGNNVLGQTPFHGKIRHREIDVTFVIRMTGYVQRKLVTRADRRISRRVALVSLASPVSPSDHDESVNPFAR